MLFALSRQVLTQCIGVFAAWMLAASATFASTNLPPLWSDAALNQPLVVTLDTPLDVRLNKPGDLFSCRLATAHEVAGCTLPEGTRLLGTIRKVAPSRRMARAGYVLPEIERVVYPDGRTWTFNLDALDKDEKPFHHPKGVTVGRMLRASVPFVTVTTADSVPMGAATSLSLLEAAPITLGARMATGMFLELYQPKFEKRWSLWHRLSYGAVRGTGVFILRDLWTRSPEPHYLPGDWVSLHLPTDRMRLLMQGVSQVPASPANP
jgi:hypothetical protein